MFITLRELVENEDFIDEGGLDLPLFVVDPQDEDNHAFPLVIEYDLTVTVAAHGSAQPMQAILLRAREDFDAVIIHD